MFRVKYRGLRVFLETGALLPFCCFDSKLKTILSSTLDFLGTFSQAFFFLRSIKTVCNISLLRLV